MMITLYCDYSIKRKTRVGETEAEKETEKQIETKKNNNNRTVYRVMPITLHYIERWQ